ncbi:lipocalin family protein [uncultured Roseobacter sp.]|uniref:lipocalin family protein n=1 Tax=uncultured Roseobacter sp. TaxID=114847 RepID=UPI0026065CE3|nr:lipocalin family protein [uncultured Roseobacter sp.]
MKNHVGPGVGIASVLRRYHVGARRTLRLAFVYAGLALIAACAPTPEPGFRDASVPITATTRFTPERFAGDWHVVAAYPSAFLPGCVDQRWQAETTEPAPRLAVFCGAGPAAYDAPMAVDPRGVMQLQSADLDTTPRALWVMWMDEDAQTAVIGTPSGEMGWILNRTRGLRADRLKAAREIMAFNGYDISRLQEGIK